MRRLSRSAALKIAALLAAFNATTTLLLFVPMIARGADELNQGIDSPPYFVVVASFAIGMTQLISAYGIWLKKRWGIVVGLLVNAVSIPLAAPGLVGAPTAPLRTAAAVGLLTSAMVIVLCLWRDPALKRA